ncbi:MAG: hypothetical protein J6Y99_11505, partial [Bacteroidales bacterium]|nr:hypothetical protein [Bacteroidales bacterium]
SFLQSKNGYIENITKNGYKNNSSESRGFQGIKIFVGQLRCYCLNLYQCDNYSSTAACAAANEC